jgi:hypothetical protein
LELQNGNISFERICFSIVDGITIDLHATNFALQIAWKNKDAQAQC